MHYAYDVATIFTILSIDFTTATGAFFVFFHIVYASLKGIERMTRTWSTVVLVICIACALTIAGCGSGSDSGTSWYGGGDGGGATTTPQITAVNNMDLPGQPVRVGDWIQIQGSGFGTSRPGTTSDGYVAFSDGTTVTKAVNYGQWSDTLVQCQVPQGTPIKALIFKESISIGVVPANSSGGGSSYSTNANPTPNPTPQPTPPSPSPTPSPTGTVTPSLSPTPTPSPSVSPTPSPSPTSGGGGGGGGTPTLVSVKVTPESAVIGHKKSPSELGLDDGAAATQEFTAKAKYSDGSEVDVTTTCTWTTTSTVGEVGGATGIFTAGVTKKYIEQAEVKATYGGKEGTAKITVGLVDVPAITVDNHEAVNLRLGDIWVELVYNNRTLIHQVDAFYAGQYEVTNKEYCEFLNDQKNKVESSGGETWWFSQGNAPDMYNGISDNGSDVYTVVNNYDGRPVIYVSWYGAVAFCNWLTEKHGIKKGDGTYDYCYGDWSATGALRWTSNVGTDGDNYHPENKGYRLATDAEWEYACRINTAAGGVSTTNYYWGDALGDDYDLTTNWGYLWFWWNSGNLGGGNENHHNVGTAFPNGLGLYDMSGNVWEWVSDWHGGTFPKDGWVEDPPYDTNPKGPKTGDIRVVRGGGWFIGASNCQSGLRDGGVPWISSGGLGFRLVRTK